MKINAEGGAKGSQWLLERKNPNKYEKKKQDHGRSKQMSLGLGYNIDGPKKIGVKNDDEFDFDFENIDIKL